MTNRRSRLPNDHNLDRPMQAYVQKLEDRQNAAADLEDLDGGALLADVIAKVNAILATQRR
jgi:hypothetical protein